MKGKRAGSFGDVRDAISRLLPDSCAFNWDLTCQPAPGVIRHGPPSGEISGFRRPFHHPFPEARQDHILLHRGLEHVEVAGVDREKHRVLRPGGQLVATVPFAAACITHHMPITDLPAIRIVADVPWFEGVAVEERGRRFSGDREPVGVVAAMAKPSGLLLPLLVCWQARQRCCRLAWRSFAYSLRVGDRRTIRSATNLRRKVLSLMFPETVSAGWRGFNQFLSVGSTPLGNCADGGTGCSAN